MVFFVLVEYMKSIVGHVSGETGAFLVCCVVLQCFGVYVAFGHMVIQRVVFLTDTLIYVIVIVDPISPEPGK